MTVLQVAIELTHIQGWLKGHQKSEGALIAFVQYYKSSCELKQQQTLLQLAKLVNNNTKTGDEALTFKLGRLCPL